MSPNQRAPSRRARAKSEEFPTPTRQQSERRLNELARARIVIEEIWPRIDCGAFPLKRVTGDAIAVWADILCDGHEIIGAAVHWRHQGTRSWSIMPMRHVDNDRWRGGFALERAGLHEYAIEAWRDLFATWRAGCLKKRQAGQPVDVEVLAGRELVERARDGASRTNTRALDALLAEIDAADDAAAALLSPGTEETMSRLGPKADVTRSATFEVYADRPAAAFSAWYELMPRSQSGSADRHGTFDDVIARLPYVRDLGFDVLYFPPIHPIGRTKRKGRNNSLEAGPDDPGSPYAIGAPEGGHDAIHPELGTFDDFARLVAAAQEHGLEIALDFAIQCSLDHPWIKEHPEWFDWRPDGTIQYAENPPKKYEDIVNVHFYGEALPDLWFALRDVVLFWIAHGVKIFRVDNPHTKPLPFWQWMIREVQTRHPEAIFLAEAFTRPKMMKRLAKIGFTQSYSYFTWRETKPEFIEYLTELTQTECREYMRPNFFANTPDINPHHLQTGGRPMFRARLVLAATLAGNYGIYNGFELCEAEPVPGREEYLDSEKYEIRAWDWDRPGNIRDDVALLNRIRHEHQAFRNFSGLRFYNAWNDHILYYGKMTPAMDSFVLVFVNLDPHNVQGADVEVPLWEFGLPDHASIEAVDLVRDTRFTLNGKVHHIRLDPDESPYAIWQLLPRRSAP
ncbi:MAG: alpha-1,4-glucan--maltose-1-phosphate maltosyltransferase [Acetobacterales bacterium]